MILANFNKSLGYLTVSVFLTATGCSEQSPKHIALNEKANDTIAIQTESALFQPLSSQQSALRQSDFEDDELPVFETKSNEPQSNEEVVVKATAKAISTHAVAKHTKSLWTRMFSLYALPEIDNPRVEEELQNFFYSKLNVN